MNDLFDYLEWRGDLTFDTDGFNEVDNLILSVFSYLDFETLVPGTIDSASVPLTQVAKSVKDDISGDSHSPTEVFYKELPVLLTQAAMTNRFKNIKLSHYINNIDYEKTEQFSALVFTLQPRHHFIAFSGTDDTLIGWKENLQMSFMDEVPAQKESAVYLAKMMARLPGKFRLGGHSKGGNLAVYAASQAKPMQQNRIIRVYNNDGPGFQTKVIQSNGYQRIIKKVVTLLPKSSLIGMLLEHNEGYQVISSRETGLMQHDPFSWKISGSGFINEHGLSESSLEINRVIRAWLGRIPLQERKNFVDAFFEIVNATGAETVSELTQDKLNKAITAIKTYQQIDSESQDNLKKVLEIFFAESQKAIRKTLGKEIEAFISKTIPMIKHESKTQNSPEKKADR